jgi:dihydrofolate synthase/folylpolyglutamate synthase
LSYARVLDRLEHRGSFERTAAPRDLSKLEGIETLLRDLGHPEQGFQVVHVAGTNGKGLTSTMLARGLQHEGFRTGCYTSPHLADIRERITLDGKWVSQQAFAHNAKAVLDLSESYGDEPYLSYFDLLTASALLTFREAGCQWVVLETGIGGRADSTNVTEKTLTLLTRVGLDHQAVLGNTLEQIAVEKLGITRPGVPLVSAEQAPELVPWLERECQMLGVPLTCTTTLPISESNGQLSLQWPDGNPLPLPGKVPSQPWLECFRTSLLALELLFPKGPEVGASRAAAIWDTRLPGRLDRRPAMQLGTQRFLEVVLDGGHNPDSLEALANQLQQWEISRYTLIVGMASDKLVEAAQVPLQTLVGQAQQTLVVPIQSPRSATPEALTHFLGKANLPKASLSLFQREVRGDFAIVGFPDLQAALAKAGQHPQQPLVITGSFYLVGEVLRTLEGSST